MNATCSVSAKKFARHAVQHEASEWDRIYDLFWNEPGRVEYVHLETVGEILIEELHAQLPFREVPGLDRFQQLARWKSGSAPLIFLTASFHTLIADRASASR
jgi:hypothetical protein